MAEAGFEPRPLGPEQIPNYHFKLSSPSCGPGVIQSDLMSQQQRLTKAWPVCPLPGCKLLVLSIQDLKGDTRSPCNGKSNIHMQECVITKDPAALSQDIYRKNESLCPPKNADIFTLTPTLWDRPVPITDK